MSKKIAGQVRIMDKSSKVDGQFIHKGIGANGMKSIIPDLNLQKTLEEMKEHSHRGRGDGKKGEVKKSGVDVHKKSSFIEPVSFHSVGGMRLVSGNIEHLSAKANPVSKKGEISSKGRKAKQFIKDPKREGKKDKSGKKQPYKLGNKPPTKSSDIVMKNVKEIMKRKIKAHKGKLGMSKKEKIEIKY
tara:strand:+ start:211 stop:771 length:561 start_codon:yes stop_codon:yes gene_type:complete